MERISQYLSVERNFWCVRIAIASAIPREDQKICHGYGLLSKSARDGRGNDSIEKAVGLDLAGGAPGEMKCVINSVRRTEFINLLRRITGGFLHSKAIYRLSSFGPAVSGRRRHRRHGRRSWRSPMCSQQQQQRQTKAIQRAHPRARASVDI